MRSLGFRAADLVEIEHQPPHRGVGLHLAAVLRRTAACQIGRRHIDPTVVGPLEPDAGTQLRILVERIDQIVERDRIVARTDAVEDETEPRRIAQPRDADERVGVERAAERAARDVVDRIQNRHLAVEMLRLGFEQFDRLLDHIAQAGALALGEVADRILHVGRRIAVLGEDRLVEIQRIGPHPPMLHVGIREECVVKDERELLVGDDLVSRTGQQQARYQYIYKSFHIPFVFNSRFPASARPKQDLVIAPCGRRPCRPHEPRAAPSRPSSPPPRPRKPPRRPPRRPRAARRGSS